MEFLETQHSYTESITLNLAEHQAPLVTRSIGARNTPPDRNSLTVSRQRVCVCGCPRSLPLEPSNPLASSHGPSRPRGAAPMARSAPRQRVHPTPKDVEPARSPPRAAHSSMAQSRSAQRPLLSPLLPLLLPRLIAPSPPPPFLPISSMHRCNFAGGRRASRLPGARNFFFQITR